MSAYAVAQLDEIDEMDDGRCPYRPVRHHLGITAFGVNAWTAREAGDRIINDRDAVGTPTGAHRRPGAPTRHGDARADGLVSIQFRVRRRWTPIGSARLRNGSFAYRARFPRRGSYLVRAVYSGDRSHRSAVSNVLAVRAVRPT